MSERPAKLGARGRCAPLTPVASFHLAFSASGCPEKYRTSQWAGFAFPRQYARGREAHLQGQERRLARAVCGAVRNEELENARGSAWKGTGVSARPCTYGGKLSRPHLGMHRERSRGPEGAQGMVSLSRYRKGPSRRCVSCTKFCPEAATAHQSRHFGHCLVRF